MPQIQQNLTGDRLKNPPLSDNLPASPTTHTNTAPLLPTVDAGASMFPTSASRYTSCNNLMSEEQQVQDLEDNAVLQETETLVVVDFEDGYAEFDAGYETSSTGTDAVSVTSSTMDYVYENGRRYHSYREGAYNFANDASEQSREHKKHLMMEYLCQGRRYHAPIGLNPQNILDLGTGTGEWAIESNSNAVREGKANTRQWQIYSLRLKSWA